MAKKEVGTELPELWLPTKKGDSIEGIYMKKKENVGKNKANLYVLEVDGVRRSVWGSTVLDDKMDDVQIRDIVTITFEGDDIDKGYHKYKVEVEIDESGEETDSEE